MLAAVFAQAEVTVESLGESVTRDSAILGEQFYFFTVVLMWLIHAGFLAYEGGVSRRKNVMATTMKNILTIAVVTPTFYYVGWWIYGCSQSGLPIGPNSSAENFVVNAAAQSRPIASALRIVSRRPARQTAQNNAVVISMSGTSFFTSGPCARMFGSRQ